VVLLILVLVTLVLFALFLGGSLLAQGYLYQQPADRLPLRALAAAVLVGSFITLWVMIDRAWPRKYDTFFEFAPYSRNEFTEFEAIRWVSPDGVKLKVDASGNLVEEVVKFKRPTEKAGAFVEEGTGAPFHMRSSSKTGSSYMTAAIRVKPAPDAEPVRFNAQVKDDSRGMKVYVGGAENSKFVEEKGSRYIQADQLGVMYVPSTQTVVFALFINVLHFVLWFVAFWAILQYTRGHALGLTVVFGLVTMLMVLPLLFKPGRAPKPVEAPKTAWIQRTEDRGQRTEKQPPRSVLCPLSSVL
jgi:hypothetical protein